MDIIKYILIGAVVGVANVIPGVSGGTMAVVCNIYDRLISCTKLKVLKKNIPFLIELLIGAVIGVLLFSKVITYLYANFPMATKLVFVGIIVGSIPMIFTNAASHCKKSERTGKPVFSIGSIISFAVMFALMIVIAVCSGSVSSGAQLDSSSFLSYVLLFLGSAFACFSMILPGVSGSFVMLVIGIYPTVLGAINGITEFSLFGTPEYLSNCLLLVPVFFGCVTGLLLGLNIVRILMEKVPAPTFFAILGLVTGSVFSVIPFSLFAVSAELFIGIVLMIAAGVATYFFARPKKEKEAAETAS